VKTIAPRPLQLTSDTLYKKQWNQAKPGSAAVMISLLFHPIGSFQISHIEPLPHIQMSNLEGIFLFFPQNRRN